MLSSHIKPTIQGNTSFQAINEYVCKAGADTFCIKIYDAALEVDFGWGGMRR